MKKYLVYSKDLLFLQVFRKDKKQQTQKIDNLINIIINQKLTTMKTDTIKKESLYMKAWQKSINLKGSAANMAANVERRQLLRCWVEYTIAAERGYTVAEWVRPTLMKAVAGVASADIVALLPAIPTGILVSAIRIDGTLNVPAIGRAMSAELANNKNTVVAVAQAAQKAVVDARHEAQKAAKKAALAAKKAAKKAAAEYAINNTCGQI